MHSKARAWDSSLMLKDIAGAMQNPAIVVVKTSMVVVGLAVPTGIGNCLFRHVSRRAVVPWPDRVYAWFLRFYPSG